MHPARVLIATVIAVLALAATALARSYAVPHELGSALITQVAAKADIGVRVPGTIDLDYGGKVYAAGSATKRTFELSLDGAKDCGGANACFLASFTGEKGGTPAFKRTVGLANGITGYYKPLTCGGSCSPPLIQWIQRGVLYSIQAKVEGNARAEMVRAANSAIRRAAR